MMASLGTAAATKSTTATTADPVQIVRCRTEDRARVMTFIDEHWSRGHVLAKDERLIDWQHGDPDDRQHCNWLLATRGSAIVGIIGYIPTRIYSRVSTPGRRVTWVALWKVLPEAGTGMGLQLLKAVERFEASDAVGVLGLNPTHPPMYRALGFKTGELRHFIAAAPGVSSFAVLEVPAESKIPSFRSGSAILSLWPETMIDTEVDALDRSLPAAGLNAGIKTARFFLNRYKNHPHYRYQVFSVRAAPGENEARGLLATRIAEANGKRVLRVIDFAGDESLFAQLGTALSDLATKAGAEYVDCWQHGMSEQTLLRLGMIEVKSVPGLVASNFFEPFAAKNGRIEFAMKGFDGLHYVTMRGDGDQDRPNRLGNGR